ncbi:MAG: hypothetical protein ACYC35_28790 [Pirellulales bacterium]|jgi:hypothetical protein
MDPQQLDERISAIQRRLRRLTVAVFLMALALLLCAAAIFGQLVNYFASDPLLYGGATAGAAVTGFVFGWLARRAG